MLADDDARLVRPDGIAIRGLRHARGWSQRDLVDAIGEAQRTATGLRETIAPALLVAIEERSVRIPYATLRLIASGLDRNPVELLESEPGPEAPTHGAPRSRSSARTPPGARAPAPPRGRGPRS